MLQRQREREWVDYLLTLQIISDCPKRLEVHKSAAAARCGCVQLSPGGQGWSGQTTGETVSRGGHIRCTKWTIRVSTATRVELQWAAVHHEGKQCVPRTGGGSDMHSALKHCCNLLTYLICRRQCRMAFWIPCHLNWCPGLKYRWIRCTWTIWSRKSCT